MVSKSISISEEAYRLLKKFQLKGESFSKTLIRLLHRQDEILSLAGAWKKIPDSKDAIELIEKSIKNSKINETDNTIKMEQRPGDIYF